ncbi:MAG TPA: hypothetical protein VKU79_03430 [Thermoplasmataceae archaeon]|nr:hypothetical protein [Thermoplasmatales archaeon AK]HLH85900.1 hypothetical protein [Thermoplasmataceae archaeon]
MLTDDTLREGLQTPGFAFSINERIEIARQLSKAGLRRALVSYPSAHWSEAEVARTIVKENLFDETYALGRTVREDIDAIYETGANISMHLPFEVADLGKIEESVKYASTKGGLVEVAIVNVAAYTPDQIIKMAKRIEMAGANVIQLPDTTGTATPNHMRAVIQAAKRSLNAKIEVHCHNDSGASVLNAFTAYEAGADYIDCTVFGIGERNGISDLGTVESILSLSGYETGINRAELRKLYELMAEILVRKLGPDFLFRNFPVYGENSGIHTAGTHAAFSGTFHGEKFSVNVYTGRSMIRRLLAANNIELNERDLKMLVEKVKDISVKEGRAMGVAEIVKLARENSGGA